MHGLPNRYCLAVVSSHFLLYPQVSEFVVEAILHVIKKLHVYIQVGQIMH